MREVMTELERVDPKALEEEDRIPPIVVQQGHLLAALDRVTPSVSVNIFFTRACQLDRDEKSLAVVIC
jgi:hypothetical protein